MAAWRAAAIHDDVMRGHQRQIGVGAGHLELRRALGAAAERRAARGQTRHSRTG